MINELLEVSELATIIKVSESTIYNWIQTKKISINSTFGIVIDLGTYKIRRRLFEKKYNINLSDEFLTFKDLGKMFKSDEATIRGWKRRKNFPEQLFSKIEGCIRIQKRIWDRFLAGEPLEDDTQLQQSA